MGQTSQSNNFTIYNISLHYDIHFQFNELGIQKITQIIGKNTNHITFYFVRFEYCPGCRLKHDRSFRVVCGFIFFTYHKDARSNKHQIRQMSLVHCSFAINFTHDSCNIVMSFFFIHSYTYGSEVQQIFSYHGVAGLDGAPENMRCRGTPFVRGPPTLRTILKFVF